jgi:hypothetical protein
MAVSARPLRSVSRPVSLRVVSLGLIGLAIAAVLLLVGHDTLASSSAVKRPGGKGIHFGKLLVSPAWTLRGGADRGVRVEASPQPFAGSSAPPGTPLSATPWSLEPPPSRAESLTDSTTMRLNATISWRSKALYLPASHAAVEGFRRQEDKQRSRDPVLLASWKQPKFMDKCLEFVPECEFFDAIGLPLMFQKCCAEHTKLKLAFLYAYDVADAYGLDLFLDSGTLLSAVRDGETLVPWETDIDLGVVGVEPELVSGPFRNATMNQSLLYADPFTGRESTSLRRTHYFETCALKVSKNVSRNGRCKDAHYVFYASTEAESKLDSSRVEIWPFWPEPDLLVHPTRKKLSVTTNLVLPLPRCRFWGRRCWCPADSVGYLTHEYGEDGGWRRPRTIHWGENDVLAVHVDHPIPTKKVKGG